MSEDGILTSETDERLMRKTLLNCYGTKGARAFRVSKEHYRYLAEQVVATREHARRLNAALSAITSE